MNVNSAAREEIKMPQRSPGHAGELIRSAPVNSAGQPMQCNDPECAKNNMGSRGRQSGQERWRWRCSSRRRRRRRRRRRSRKSRGVGTRRI
ncbi:hypothetical protein M433DRAFT_324300 [Acidomyces richmondensis BFW]|nr:MAG: hypothetical protein FE78DRAFT_463695 [Acidomyces sp. 'richmondensis']KYG44024.1 hypothetical protein M433DRAFT_324300 [Acidomyces richmondensis BFW]